MKIASEASDTAGDVKSHPPGRDDPSLFGIKRGDKRMDDFFEGFSITKAQRIMEQRVIARALASPGGNRTQAAKLLASVGIESDRVQMVNLSAGMGERFAQTAAEFTEKIRQLGPNPIKLAGDQKSSAVGE